MDELNSLITDLEHAIQDAKFYIKKNKSVVSNPNLILGCGTVATVVSLYALPKWATVILMVLLSGYAIMEKINSYSNLTDKLDEIQRLIDKINQYLIETEQSKNTPSIVECQEKEETIAFLKSTVERLKGLLAKKDAEPKPKEENSEPTKAELNQTVLLKKLQSLDIEVQDFGEECSTYMRMEFAKTLRICGLEFVDFSEDTKSMFDTETAAINNIDCTSRAIATLSSPKEVVLRGHAFIPEN